MGISDPLRPLFLSISVHCHLPFIFFLSNPQHTSKQKQQTLPTAHSVKPGLKTYWHCIYSSFYPNLSTLPRLILLFLKKYLFLFLFNSFFNTVQNIGELLKWRPSFYSLAYFFYFISALWWAWCTSQPDRHFLWTVSSTGREHYRDQPSRGVLFWWTEC